MGVLHSPSSSLSVSSLYSLFTGLDCRVLDSPRERGDERACEMKRVQRRLQPIQREQRGQTKGEGRESVRGREGARERERKEREGERVWIGESGRKSERVKKEREEREERG